MNRKPHYRRHSQADIPAPAPLPPDGVVVSCPCGVEIGTAALERLEELDDTIFAALDGDPDALDRTRTLWSDVRSEIEAPLIAESQQQYARRAESVWQAYRSNPGESLAQAFAALEVLCLVGQSD